MAETYCGKTCTACSLKEALDCRGCKAGPGKPNSGDCTLARCARSRGHVTCESCNFQVNCGTLRGRNHAPEQRRLQAQVEEARLAEVTRRAPILKRWLFVLFWLIIPNTLSTVMTSTTVVHWLPVLYMPGVFLSIVCAAVYGAVLLLLSEQNEHYRTAGIFRLISAAVNLGSVFVQTSSPIGLLLSAASVIVGIIGTYQEFTAHAAVLTGADNAMSGLWSSLWKWYIGSLGAMLGSIILMFMIPLLGMILLIAAAIAVTIVGITNIVFLYKTAQCFSVYC